MAFAASEDGGTRVMMRFARNPLSAGVQPGLG